MGTLNAPLSGPTGDDMSAAGDSGDDERFVPRRGQWVAMALALLFLASSLGYAVGARRDGAPEAGSVDVGFLQDMISHHAQAIRLSNLELINGVEPDVQVFAREILYQQSYEMGSMDRQLALWGFSRAGRPATAMAWMNRPVPEAQMPGLADDAEMLLMETRTGREADALFVPLMKDHHLGGIHMAEYAAEHASTEFVRDVAARMAAAQRQEIHELTLAQRRAELAEHPDGYVPAEFPAAAASDGGHDEHG